MNKRFLLAISLALIIFGGMIGWFVYNQSTKLTIQSTDQDFEIAVKDQANNTTLIKPNQSVRLKKQQYTIAIRSDKYTAPQQTVDLTKPTIIKFDLDFSQDYATKFFQKDREQLQKTVQTQFPSTDVNKILFYKRGQYAVVGIYKPLPPASKISNVSVRLRQASSRPIFKVIFKKDQEKWAQLNQPEVIFYHKQHPQIPREILQSANDFLTP